MNFTALDLCGFAAAAALGVILLVLPGLALSSMLGVRIDDREASAPAEPLAGVLAGLALLPELASVSARLVSLDFALAATLALAAYGLVICRRRGLARVARVAWTLLAVWFVLLAAESIDFDVFGRLFQPIQVFDGVKHAATTQAILESGAPPRDAFFLRPEHSAYYYFYYTLAALILRICGGLIDARMAFAGLTFWAGVAAYGAVRLTLTKLGTARPRTLLIVAVMGASGLDCLAVILIRVAQGYWLIDPLQWNVQVGVWVEDLMWVPHHVTALSAGLVGCVALCDALDAPRDRRPWRCVATAALALAACFGLSVWVFLAFVVTLAFWSVTMLAERRWRAIAILSIAGLLALLLVTPQLIDLQAGRAGGEIPVVFAVRAFTPVSWFVSGGPLNLSLRVLALPLNYAVEFGVLTIGAAAAWRLTGSHGTFPRLLLLMALTGLLLGGFLCSTQLGNDLGWRVTLLPLLAGTAWTIVVLDRAIAAGNSLLIPTALVLMTFGWATTLYGLVAARVYPFIASSPFASFVSSTTDTAHELRAAYEWAARRIPPSAVLQHNPTPKRALAFGLYGHQTTAVGDAFSSLYGADPDKVTARIAVLGPIFNGRLGGDGIQAIASREKVDALVVTANDPVWSQPDSFVWRTKPIYAAPRVRIIPVASIGARP